MSVRATAAVAAVLVPAAASQAFVTYHLGNSLTGDARPMEVASIARQNGLHHTARYHIRSSAAINYHWTFPNDSEQTFLSSSEDRWNNAFANQDLDVVTFQPYYDVLGGAGGADVLVGRMVSEFLRTGGRNADTRLLIYAAWPVDGNLVGYPANGPSYFTGRWNVPFDHAVQEFWSRQTRDFHEQFLLSVRANVDSRIDMIPVGDVLVEFERRARLDGGFAGFTDASALYRDSYHMNNIGRAIAGMTFFSVLHGQSPVGTTGWNVYTPDMTASQIEEFQNLVWDVVSVHPYAGIPEPAGAAGVLAAAVLLLRRRRAA